MSSFTPRFSAVLTGQSISGTKFKQILEESECRILAEIREMKDELVEEVRRIQQKPHASAAQEVVVRQLSPVRPRSADELDSPGRLYKMQSSASSWVAESPKDVMGSYLPLMHQERDHFSAVSKGVSSLRRFVGGFRASDREQAHVESSCLTKIVASQAFDGLASCFVIINAVFIGFEVHMRCQYKFEMPDGWTKFFLVAGHIFLAFFFIEWVLRIGVAGLSFFSCSNEACHWKWLDTLSVGLQVIDQAYFFLIQHHRKVGTSFGLVRIMRLLRVLRIFRVLRLLHLSDELGMLAHAIVRSLSTVCWALVLMVTIVYAFSVTFTERVWSVRGGNVHGRLAYYFSDVPRTMLTLTESVLGGLSWDEPVWLLFSEVGWLVGLMFVGFVFLAFFILCNVVTGIFNDGISKSADQEAHRQLAMKLQLAIGMGDPTRAEHSDLRHDITWEEFRDKVLYDVNMRTYFHSINIEPTEIAARKVFEFLDVDQDKVLTRGEVFYGCLKLREPARAVDVSLLMHNIAEIEKGLEYLIINTNRLNEKQKSEQTSNRLNAKSKSELK